MDNLYSKFQPIEQARWQQANIDTLFYAGSQSYVNRMFNFAPGMSYQQYYFNLVQQPINMVTGRQRQHRKQPIYQAADGADPHTTDQYTRLILENSHKEGINEVFSKSCELAAVAGINLMQPYLDFTGDDPAQGQLKVKVWEYNSFLVDPYFRQPDMSDANWVWCQEYITRDEAKERFGDKVNTSAPMMGSPQRFGNFYFLPENYNLNRNDLMVVSYVWYKWRKRKKRLYSRTTNMFFDFGKEAKLDMILQGIPDLEVVEVTAPCWKLATVLNDQLMFIGENPLWDGAECPFIPTFWNYDPHISQYDLRSRSLIYAMRSPQFLFNYKVITNNDMAAATINSGYKRKIGAVANEDNLKKAQAGFDIIINEGYEMTDVEKIIPTAVPESDLALAQQMADLIFKVSGIDMENWAGQQDKQVSSLTLLMKMDANLLPFQKYFDQWDYSLKLLGERMLQLALNNWNEQKVGMILGEEPSEHFFSKIFAKYKTVTEEGLLTATQRNLQAQSLLDINAAFGREVFPPSMIVKNMNIQGKAEAVEYLQEQEEQMSAAQSEEMNIKHSFEEMKIKELIAKINNQLSQARERDARSESNVGLFEERMSMITKNHALADKEKMDALTKLLEAVQKFGELETFLKANKLESIQYDDQEIEKAARVNVERSEASKKFLERIMGTQVNINQGGQTPQQSPEMAGMR